MTNYNKIHRYLKVLIVCHKLHYPEPNVITDKISSFVDQLKYNINIPEPKKENKVKNRFTIVCKNNISKYSSKPVLEYAFKRDQLNRFAYQDKSGANFSARIAAFRANSSRIAKSAVARY